MDKILQVAGFLLLLLSFAAAVILLLSATGVLHDVNTEAVEYFLWVPLVILAIPFMAP